LIEANTEDSGIALRAVLQLMALDPEGQLALCPKPKECVTCSVALQYGDLLPYTAGPLRRDMDEVRQQFDPDRSDAAWDPMMLVGHSMGGLLTNLMVQDSGTRLWRLISDRPPEHLAGDSDECDRLRRALCFQPAPGGQSRHPRHQVIGTFDTPCSEKRS
jgi:pimeloyl-ACP methyl ester carboxylesterase